MQLIMTKYARLASGRMPVEDATTTTTTATVATASTATATTTFAVD